MKKTNFSILIFTLIVLFISFKIAYSDENGNHLHGKVVGIIEVPINIANQINRERKKLSKKIPNLKEFYKKQRLEISADNKFGEVINPLEKLTVKIGNKISVTDGNGEFFFEEIPELFGKSEIEIEILFAERLIEKIYVKILTENETEDVIIRRSLKNISMSSNRNKRVTAKEEIPCLDNNGISKGRFLYSDCFASLFYGPPWYNWMCWAEAMERDERRGEHESKNNIWCDGSHNCSLFVHGWD